jgi:Spy/CpxP family protein refolding chaperone
MAPSPTICYHYPIVSTSFSQFLEGEFPMARTMLGRLACWTTLVSLAVVFATVEQPVVRADGPVKKALAKRTRRARFYDQVATTDEQREKIRKIEEEYDPKIAALQAQIRALQKERNAKITAVLTPEQKKQIEDAKAKAKENRKAAKAESPKPAETTPATPPAEPTPAK